MSDPAYFSVLRAEIDTAADAFGVHPEEIVNEALEQPRTVACSVCYGSGKGRRRGTFCRGCQGLGRIVLPERAG